MGLITDQKLTTVQATGRGLQIDTYNNRYDLVVQTLNSGRLSEQGVYGSIDHYNALKCVEREIKRIKMNIRLQNREEKCAGKKKRK